MPIYITVSVTIASLNCRYYTGICFGIILRHRTIHTVVIVLELHMAYITYFVYELVL